MLLPATVDLYFYWLNRRIHILQIVAVYGVINRLKLFFSPICSATGVHHLIIFEMNLFCLSLVEAAHASIPFLFCRSGAQPFTYVAQRQFFLWSLSQHTFSRNRVRILLKVEKLTRCCFDLGSSSSPSQTKTK